jgi:hypothetical protein
VDERSGNGIQELKKALARQMLKRHSPKRLWDDCLEFQAHIASNTAGNYFGARSKPRMGKADMGGNKTYFDMFHLYRMAFG